MCNVRNCLQKKKKLFSIAILSSLSSYTIDLLSSIFQHFDTFLSPCCAKITVNNRQFSSLVCQRLIKLDNLLIIFCSFSPFIERDEMKYFYYTHHIQYIIKLQCIGCISIMMMIFTWLEVTSCRSEIDFDYKRKNCKETKFIVGHPYGYQGIATGLYYISIFEKLKH